MAKRIAWTAQARADMRGIERPTAMRILKTLGRYAGNGLGDTKQLLGVEPRYSAFAPKITGFSFETTGITSNLARAGSQGCISLKMDEAWGRESGRS
jgi:hypothetical protein